MRSFCRLLGSSRCCHSLPQRMEVLHSLAHGGSIRARPRGLGQNGAADQTIIHSMVLCLGNEYTNDAQTAPR
eukprot:1660484-Alexandrium_andersonii.AAC.1